LGQQVYKVNLLKGTLARHSPIDPVPQQMSMSVVFSVGHASSATELYSTSAADVLIWKKASGDTRNFKPNNVS
jgi:hypothetical protein